MFILLPTVEEQRLKMELDLQSLFGLHVLCAQMRPRTPPPRIRAHIRECYWSAKTDDISVLPPDLKEPIAGKLVYKNYCFRWRVGRWLAAGWNMTASGPLWRYWYFFKIVGVYLSEAQISSPPPHLTHCIRVYSICTYSLREGAEELNQRED